jgi:hypothetical protein
MNSHEKAMQIAAQSAEMLANKRGGKAYRDLCAQWSETPTAHGERLFKAAMAVGVTVGIEACLRIADEAK